MSSFRHSFVPLEYLDPLEIKRLTAPGDAMGCDRSIQAQSGISYGTGNCSKEKRSDKTSLDARDADTVSAKMIVQASPYTSIYVPISILSARQLRETLVFCSS